MKRGRKRNPNAIRDKKGIPRGEGYHPETIANRERVLKSMGIPLAYLKAEGSRVVEKPTAIVNLAGFTLGLLHLRWQNNPNDRMGVSEIEYKAGEAWSHIVRRHAQVMDFELKRNVASPQWSSVGRGISTKADPEDEEVLKIRARYRACYNALVRTGWQTADLVYSVCIDNIPVADLTERHVHILKCGLRALAKELG